MRHRFATAAVFLFVLLAPSSSRADGLVRFKRNVDDAATDKFMFKELPSPSKTDAATTARFEILQGRRDRNGGEVNRLNDGQLPKNEDDPQSNFFFAAGSTGGRLLLDLGSVRDVHGVYTYSWHKDTRAAQVYRLFGSDGAAENFQPKPAADTNLRDAGWQPLASVDTRPKDGAPGGQHAASITGQGSRPLGRFRYLLFDVAATDPEDRFSNTFFSEIDVDDGQVHERPSIILTSRGDNFEINFDLTETPDLKEWCEEKLQPVCEHWYPRIVTMLESEGYTAPQKFSVVFHRDMRGVAHTAGRDVHCAAAWFRRNLEGEAVGAVVHELVHVVQQYGRVRGRNRNPGWLVEGVADYIRWFLYEPPSQRPEVNPARANYTDSYRTTAAFLHYLVETHDRDLIKKLNAAMRDGKYHDGLWKELIGKDVDTLWQDFIESLRKR